MIRIKNLSYTYKADNRSVLHDINIEITPGTYISIIGPNGSGKTTFVKHLNALLTPSSGSVCINGMVTTDCQFIKAIRQKVGMVFQNPDNQIVGMTVEEDVAFGPENLNVPPSEIKKRVDESLEMVGISRLINRAPHTLSNGEKQLVAIAGVLAMSPEYIVLDEPTTFLDPLSRKRVCEVIDRLHQQHITIIHVTHNMEEAAEANRIIVLNEGKVFMDAEPARIFAEGPVLKKMGLDIPMLMELMWQLKNTGVDVKTDLFTLDKAFNEIAALIEEKRS